MDQQLTLNQAKSTITRQKLIIYIILAIITVAVFWQVNKFDFINFDDNLYVTANPNIMSGITLQGFTWAFTTRYFDFWTPLVWLSFMLDYQLYGLKAGGYHVTNLIFHVLSTLLLFWLFCRMTGAVWKSAFVAAFFALHPLHVESVVWVSERKDVLSAFFWMLTLCLYVFYTERPNIKRYLAVIFAFILALLSKPMVVTLPAIMILLDYWPLNRFDSKKENLFSWQLKEKFIFFILSSVLTIVTIYNPNNHGIQEKIDIIHFPLLSRLANDSIAYVVYLEKTLWPHDMTIFYPFISQISAWKVTGSLLLIILITAISIVIVKSKPYVLVGWLWFAFSLLPVLGTIHICSYMMADHYHYLTSIGLAIILAWSTPAFIRNEQLKKRVLFLLSVVVLIIMASLTWKQCNYWKDSIELWQHALNVTDNNYIAHNNIASALLEKGDTEKAIYHYNEAIRINRYAKALHNMGIIYYNLGRYQQAIEYFNQAIREKHDYSTAHYSLGNTYLLLGQHQFALGQYNETIEIRPDHANAYNSRAFIYLLHENMIAGCSNAQKACKLGNCKTLAWAREKGFCK